MDGQLLPEAYRSRPRPSSALGAKASTVCPSYLDREEHRVLLLWSFQGARGPRPPRAPERGGLSKLNSVADIPIEVDVASRRAGHEGPTPTEFELRIP